VTDEILTKTFSKYPSFLKAKVVRDKRTDKSRGYGFISFAEPDDFARAWKEMNGNYFLICSNYRRDARILCSLLVYVRTKYLLSLVYLNHILSRKICGKPPDQVEEKSVEGS
jgi:RNA recognition motif-containing protein